MVTSNSITFVRSTRILKHNTPLLALVPLRVTGLQSVVSVPLQPGHTLLPGYHTLLLIAFDVTWRGTGGNSLSAPPLLHLTCLQIYPGVSKWQHTLLVTISRAPTSYELHFLFNCGRAQILTWGPVSEAALNRGWSHRWMEPGLPQGEIGAAEFFPCGRRYSFNTQLT